VTSSKRKQTATLLPPPNTPDVKIAFVGDVDIGEFRVARLQHPFSRANWVEPASGASTTAPASSSSSSMNRRWFYVRLGTAGTRVTRVLRAV